MIGCLTGTGGVADEAAYLLRKFSKETGATVIQDHHPKHLLDACLTALRPGDGLLPPKPKVP